LSSSSAPLPPLSPSIVLMLVQRSSFAFEERGSANVHCLSSPLQIFLPVCIFCWRGCLRERMGEAKMLLPIRLSLRACLVVLYSLSPAMTVVLGF
jgi:hypothetical protein